ncbi:MAG: MFS transporter [Kiloniellaceae bacterium]
MVQTLIAVSSLLLGVGVMMLGNSLLGIALPLKMNAAGISTEVTGVIMAAHFAGLLAGAIYGKRLIIEVGHIRAFAGFGAIMAAVGLAHAMLLHALSWGMLRFLYGFCIAGVFAAMESWLNERSGNETRGRLLGIYMIVHYAATVTGQLMINLWDLAGVQAFVMASLLISLSLVPVALTRVEAPDLSELRPLSFRELHGVSPLAVIGCGVTGLMMGAYYGIGPIFARQLGFGVFEVSLFMGSVILGALVLQWPIGRLSDRYDRRTVLLTMLALTVLVCAAGIGSTVFRDPLPVLLGLGALLGGAMTSVYPISLAQAYDYLTRDRYVAASGGLLLAYALGATAGPVLAAVVMGALGAHAFFGYIGLVAGGFMVFVFYRMQARAPLPAEQQESFVALPRMSPVAAELDPRSAAPDGGFDDPRDDDEAEEPEETAPAEG